MYKVLAILLAFVVLLSVVGPVTAGGSFDQNGWVFVYDGSYVNNTNVNWLNCAFTMTADAEVKVEIDGWVTTLSDSHYTLVMKSFYLKPNQVVTFTDLVYPVKCMMSASPYFEVQNPPALPYRIYLPFVGRN